MKFLKPTSVIFLTERKRFTKKWNMQAVHHNQDFSHTEIYRRPKQQQKKTKQNKSKPTISFLHLSWHQRWGYIFINFILLFLMK